MITYKIITRKEAKDKGLTRYFTGIPCKHGHLTERLVSSKYCIECQNLYNRKRRGSDPSHTPWLNDPNYESYNSPSSSKKREANARRRARCRKACHPDYIPEVRQIYKDCPPGYQVDHIVPLNGETVCGLHVPWNLQYLTPQENVKKGNRLIDK